MAYPPPYAPYPPPPAPRRRRGWIIAIVIAAGVLGLCCVGGVAAYLLSDHSTSASSPAAPRYAEPPDRCTLLAADMVSDWAGTLKTSTPEQADFPAEVGGKVNGCSHDLRADSLNTFKVFATVSGDAKARYDYTLKAYTFIGGIKTAPVAGLGTAATSYTQQGTETRQIQAGLTLHDDNLYLEIRFIGGGTKPWDPTAVRQHLTDVARTILGKVPKS